MMRGTFANIRIKNEIVPNTEGGITHCFINDKQMSIYDAAMEYISKALFPLDNYCWKRIWNWIIKRLGCKRNSLIRSKSCYC